MAVKCAAKSLLERKQGLQRGVWEQNSAESAANDEHPARHFGKKGLYKKLMYGHRWRLACLDCSFIGWFLLVVATWGLAGIFVMPYFAAANAAFYEDLLDRTEH